MTVDDAVEFVSVDKVDIGRVDVGRVDVGIVGLAGAVDVCVDVVGVGSVAVGVPNKEFKAFVNIATGVVEEAVVDAVGFVTGAGAVEIGVVEVVGVVRTGVGAVADAVGSVTGAGAVEMGVVDD